MAVPKPRNGPGANSTLSVAAMLRGPCELFSTDGHFGPLRVAYDGAFELWNRFYGDFVDLAAASPNVLVLRYEDILRNETGAIREIAARALCPRREVRPDLGQEPRPAEGRAAGGARGPALEGGAAESGLARLLVASRASHGVPPLRRASDGTAAIHVR